MIDEWIADGARLCHHIQRHDLLLDVITGGRGNQYRYLVCGSGVANARPVREGRTKAQVPVKRSVNSSQSSNDLTERSASLFARVFVSALNGQRNVRLVADNPAVVWGTDVEHIY